jgi:hypothetical protein
MLSKITQGPTTLLFTTKVLDKYDVRYYRCNETGFIQTEEPYWLPEAYSDAITKLDVGLAHRNLLLSDKVSKVLGANFDTKGKFLDYAGGYGLFTRLMRDKGFDFYNTDKYCKNIFAEYFDLTDLPAGTPFEVTTAFEVFEHLPDPIPGIQEMVAYSDNLLFTTELQPDGLKDVNDWWYFIPETGQHVALYNEASLKYIALQLGYNFHTDGVSLHLFTKETFAHNPVAFSRDPFLVRKAKKLMKKKEQKLYGKQESLLQQDWQYIKDKLNAPHLTLPKGEGK